MSPVGVDEGVQVQFRNTVLYCFSYFLVQFELFFKNLASVLCENSKDNLIKCYKICNLSVTLCCFELNLAVQNF